MSDDHTLDADLALPPLEEMGLTLPDIGPPTPPPPAPALTGAASAGDLERLTDVLVELAVEVGRARMTLGETLALGPGSVVSLERLADKPVDLLVNGRPIARGEVVVIDEQFGLRITEVIGAEPATRATLAPVALANQLAPGAGLSAAA